jgi:hypothetical protein
MKVTTQEIENQITNNRSTSIWTERAAPGAGHKQLVANDLQKKYSYHSCCSSDQSPVTSQ